MECLRENLEFEKWMYETARKSSEQSRIGKAVKYTFPLMPRLGRYVNDGRFCIDNNLVENAVRALDLGRKTSCSAGITMLLSYTLWSVAAKLWGETRVNGWRTCCSGSPETRINGTCSVDSCLAEGQRRPSKINFCELAQL